MVLRRLVTPHRRHAQIHSVHVLRSRTLSQPAGRCLGSKAYTNTKCVLRRFTSSSGNVNQAVQSEPVRPPIAPIRKGRTTRKTRTASVPVSAAVPVLEPEPVSVPQPQPVSVLGPESVSVSIPVQLPEEVPEVLVPSLGTTIASPHGALDEDACIFGKRLERSYSITHTYLSDLLEATCGKHMKRDKYYPVHGKLVDTVFIRSPNPDEQNQDKFRVRSYPHGDVKNPLHDKVPTFIEHKIKRNGLTLKERMEVDKDFVDRLLAGESAAAILQGQAKTPQETKLVEHCVRVVDELGYGPVVHQTYRRVAYECEGGKCRVTIDRGVVFEGLGPLAAAGTLARKHAILDIKVTGEIPAWVATMMSNHFTRLRNTKNGKGGTALRKLNEALKNREQRQTFDWALKM